MKKSFLDPSPGVLAFGGLLFTSLVLVAVGPPSARKPPAIATTASPAPAPSQVAGPGITLVSVSVDLPDDVLPFPDGPHADVINANCTSCHSATMALSQPRLSGDQWKSIVEKMRATYKAPVPASAVPDILDYLNAMSGKLPVNGSSPTASADRSGGTG